MLLPNPVAKLFFYFVPITLVWVATAQASPRMTSEQENAQAAKYSEEARVLAGDIPAYHSWQDDRDEILEAINNEQFDIAENHLQQVLARSQYRHRWHYFPIATVIENIGKRNSPTLLVHLNHWRQQKPNSAMAHLIRTNYMEAKAAPNPTSMAGFMALKEALADAEQADKLAPQNPLGLFYKMRAMIDKRAPEVSSIFSRAIQRFPDYYPFYRDMQSATLSVEGGNLKDLYNFTYSYADNGDPALKMLYVKLYKELLFGAHYSCHQDQRGVSFNTCMQQVMNELTQADLEPKLTAALNSFTADNRYFFSQEINYLLADMLSLHGAGMHAHMMMQLASDALGNNNELSAQDVTHNNYFMDRLTARIWRDRKHIANAETLYKRALQDIDDQRFPSTAAQALARAEIYTEIAKMYTNRQRYKDAIVYQKAAELLQHRQIPKDSYILCIEYWSLKQYRNAIKTGTDLLQQNLDTTPLWAIQSIHDWRGHAYDALNQVDAAISDYRQTATLLHNNMAANAVIDWDVLLSKHGRHQEALDLLNSYPFLFDEQQRSANTLAVVYNNRCYSKMQLKMYREALDDCQKSLTFDQIPDALNKQQQLIKILSKSKNPSTGI